jgi:hypothetical protein
MSIISHENAQVFQFKKGLFVLRTDGGVIVGHGRAYEVLDKNISQQEDPVFVVSQCRMAFGPAVNSPVL